MMYIFLNVFLITPTFVSQMSLKGKREIDGMVMIWVVKRCRPFGIMETDTELNAVFRALSNGAYTGPCRETVICTMGSKAQHVTMRMHMTLSNVLIINVMITIDFVHHACVCCLLLKKYHDARTAPGRFKAVHIYRHRGKNYVSLLAVMVHWIDGSWQLLKRLVICEPYGKVSHTCEGILQTTKRRFAAVNVGELTDADDLEGFVAVDTVCDPIFQQIKWIKCCYCLYC
jgi:hypothetical protein